MNGWKSAQLGTGQPAAGTLVAFAVITVPPAASLRRPEEAPVFRPRRNLVSRVVGGVLSVMTGMLGL
jgi:hypothetical protein